MILLHIGKVVVMESGLNCGDKADCIALESSSISLTWRGREKQKLSTADIECHVTSFSNASEALLTDSAIFSSSTLARIRTSLG